MRVSFFIGGFEGARNLTCLNLNLASSSNHTENQKRLSRSPEGITGGLELVTNVELELAARIVELVSLDGDTKVDADRTDWQEQAKADTHV